MMQNLLLIWFYLGAFATFLILLKPHRTPFIKELVEALFHFNIGSVFYIVTLYLYLPLTIPSSLLEILREKK